MDFKLYSQAVTVTPEGRILSKEAYIRYAVKVAIAGPPVGPQAGNAIIAKLQDSYGAENITDVTFSKAENKEAKDKIF